MQIECGSRHFKNFEQASRRVMSSPIRPPPARMKPRPGSVPSFAPPSLLTRRRIAAAGFMLRVKPLWLTSGGGGGGAWWTRRGFRVFDHST
jgi:hypothetical protein